MFCAAMVLTPSSAGSQKQLSFTLSLLVICLIALAANCAGARSAVNPHAACDVADVGDEGEVHRASDEWRHDVRRLEDLDSAALTYAEAKAIASGNPDRV